MRNVLAVCLTAIMLVMPASAAVVNTQTFDVIYEGPNQRLGASPADLVLPDLTGDPGNLFFDVTGSTGFTIEGAIGGGDLVDAFTIHIHPSQELGGVYTVECGAACLSTITVDPSSQAIVVANLGTGNLLEIFGEFTGNSSVVVIISAGAAANQQLYSGSWRTTVAAVPLPAPALLLLSGLAGLGLLRRRRTSLRRGSPDISRWLDRLIRGLRGRVAA